MGNPHGEQSTYSYAHYHFFRLNLTNIKTYLQVIHVLLTERINLFIIIIIMYRRGWVTQPQLPPEPGILRGMYRGGCGDGWGTQPQLPPKPGILRGMYMGQWGTQPQLPLEPGILRGMYTGMGRAPSHSSRLSWASSEVCTRMGGAPRRFRSGTLHY